MSYKDEYIAKHGEEAYGKRLEQRRKWGGNLPGGEAQRSRERRGEYPEAFKIAKERYNEKHPEVRLMHNREGSRKGGRRYEKKQIYKHTGLQGEKNKIRGVHANRWRQYKLIIAPGSQLHHQWMPGTAKYTGLALVEANQHMQGIIKVIKIVCGKITLLTEKEIKEQNQNTQPWGHGK